MTANAAGAANDEQISVTNQMPVRAVIDTSVLLRYLIKPSAAIRELIETRWLGGQVLMITAPELLDELADVLTRPALAAYVQPEDGQALLDAIRLLAEMVPELGAIPGFTRDAKDDKFIACALIGAARFVVTSDKDLLVVGEVSGVRTITPYDFLKQLGSQRS